MSSPPPTVSGGLPLLGHLLEFYKDHLGLFKRGYQEHGELFAIRLGPWPMAIFTGLELNKLFFGRTDKELRMDKAYAYLKAMFGEVAFTQPPEAYEAERHILQAPFKGQRMKLYIEIMNEEVQAWMETLGDEGEFELVEQAQSLSQQVSAHALMGRAFRDRMGPEFWALYLDLAQGLDPILPTWLPIPKFLRRDRAKARLRPMLRKIIEERRSGEVFVEDMLQSLAEARLKDDSLLPVESVVSYVLALVFAGFETTTGHMSWALIHLLQHPDIQQKLLSQLDEVMDERQVLEPGDLRQATLLRMAVRETERLRPVADRHVRVLAEDLDAGGYRIPKGWSAMAGVAVTHRSEKLYTDPDTYDPFRFERGEGKHPLSTIGFGGGKHKCTGFNFAYNEISIWLAHLLRTYELTLLTPDPGFASTAGVLIPEPTRIRYRRR